MQYIFKIITKVHDEIYVIVMFVNIFEKKLFLNYTAYLVYLQYVCIRHVRKLIAVEEIKIIHFCVKELTLSDFTTMCKTQSGLDAKFSWGARF